jgi:hypothetical protein
MHASQSNSSFNRTVYRDFALFALAAVGVGIAVSLALATTIVLLSPGTSHTAQGPRLHKTQVAHAQTNNAASIRQPAAS